LFYTQPPLDKDKEIGYITRSTSEDSGM